VPGGKRQEACFLRGAQKKQGCKSVLFRKDKKSWGGKRGEDRGPKRGSGVKYRLKGADQNAIKEGKNNESHRKKAVPGGLRGETRKPGGDGGGERIVPPRFFPGLSGDRVKVFTMGKG